MKKIYLVLINGCKTDSKSKKAVNSDKYFGVQGNLELQTKLMAIPKNEKLGFCGFGEQRLFVAHPRLTLAISRL